MAADPRTAWILNLDADLELAAGAPGRGPSGEGPELSRYAPTKSVLAAMGAHVETLARSLLGPDDVLFDAPGAEGRRGRAFCPTPRAIALLRAAGVEPEPHPPVEVLRRVNSRAFCAELGQTLPGAAFVRDLETARAMLERPAGRGFRVKRAFGMAGRGQRVVRTLTESDLSFVRASLAAGVQIEPELALEVEYALHGMLSATGECALGRLVRQRCDAYGAWLATEPVDAPEVDTTLRVEALRVAGALHEAGYFGPFGIDAFVYLADGRRLLQPRSEINARYSMGFAIGFPPRAA